MASAPGTYYVVANLFGCVVGDSSVTINSVPAPQVTLAPDFATCNDTTILASATGGTPGYTYLWSDGSTAASTADNNIGATSYTVTVTDANHCTAISNVQTVTINHPIADISITPSDSVFLNDSVTVTAIPSGISNYTYAWTAFDSSIVRSPNTINTEVIAGSPGRDTIHLTVTDPASGCSFNKDTFIVVIEFGGFKMPTAFTPNGDGKNDHFYPAFNGPNSPAHATAFRIYNRWGQLVYDNPNAPGWDGNFAGNQQPSETYLYFITVEYPDPNNAAKTVQKSVEGSFQLFR